MPAGPSDSAAVPDTLSAARPTALSTAHEAEHVTGYRHLEPVGRGASSVVYEAYQEAFDRVVAVKVLAVDTDDDARRRFLNEVRLTARLTGHPHVVTILDAGMTWSGRPYLATEYFERGSLASLLRAEGPLPEPRVALIGAKIADALAAAHRFGIVHGDVTPNNIFISAFGEPALGDFGVSALRPQPQPQLENTGGEGFTPLHAAPEVLAGGLSDPAADVYALGSTLYRLLAGRPAFSVADEDVSSLLAVVAAQDPPPLPGEPGSALAAAIRRAMARAPQDRWPDAEAFAGALRECAAPVAAPSSLEQTAPGHGRRREPIAIPQDAGYPPNVAAGLDPASSSDPAAAAATASQQPPAPTNTAPSVLIEPGDQAARALWERRSASLQSSAQSSARAAAPNAALSSPPLSTTMIRADRALAAEAEAAPEHQRGKGRLILSAVAAAAIGAVIAFAVAGLRGRPAPAEAATAPPPTSAAPPATSVPSAVLDASRPSNVVVTPEADPAKVRVDWHIAPGNDHALAVQIQSAFGGSRPQTVLVPAGTSSYEATGLDTRAPGYCFAVGAVVAWGNPSQIAWSAPRCTPGAQVVTPSSNTSG